MVNMFQRSIFLTNVFFRFLFIVLILNSFDKSICFANYKIPKIKVKIGSTIKTIFISGTDLRRTNHISNRSKKYGGSKSIKYNCDFYSKKRIQSVIKNKPILLASLNSQTGLIAVKSDKEKKVKRYRGKLHLITSPRGDSCDIVNEVSIENYISTLLSKEMNGGWPIEALKAQAIAARTYAIHKMKHSGVSKQLGFKAYYDLESSEKHQVSGEFFDITPSTLKATSKTIGKVLYSKSGLLTPIFFHARCGGQTLLPNHVWQNKVSGYNKVKCVSCEKSIKGRWKKNISLKRFIKFLTWAEEKKYISPIKTAYEKLEFRFIADKRTNTFLRLYLGDQLITLKKPLLRRYFGRVLFPSNYFSMNYDKRKGIFPVTGKGLGHGVGMCQIGALALAKKGWSYKKILAHYFPGHKLKKIY